MNESPQEMRSRVQQMTRDHGDTWDLSRNDRNALRYILGLVNLMADEIAEFRGTTAPEVERLTGQRVYQTMLDAQSKKSRNP